MCLPMDLLVKIPEDDPVLLLNAIMERMDFSKFQKAYSRFGRIEYSPRILTKILVYGYFRKIYSSHEIHRACKENINFMYLLEGEPAPSVSTLCRFRRNVLSVYGEDLLFQLVHELERRNVLSLDSVFIDGTKIETNANRYTFVWRKSTQKNWSNLQETLHRELPVILREHQIRYSLPKEIPARTLHNILTRLYCQKEEQHLEFVHGTGKRKPPLQHQIEEIEQWKFRLEKYEESFSLFQGRNSYSKTDHDATFMRMKEDHMRNGQLKPGYNVNVATACGFIVGNYISADRSDVNTLIPISRKLLSQYTIRNVVADAGYESEENYSFYEKLPQTELWVKPSNYEQQKKRKYRTDISRKENMVYDAQKDIYLCAGGKELHPSATRHYTTKSGYVTETTIYQCEDCSHCPLKKQCIKSKSKEPWETRGKKIYVSKTFQRQRQEMTAKIQTTEGKLLRANRSIQAEGTFAVVKEDQGFRRFFLRGRYKVEAEWILLSLAYNLLKLHQKIQNGRLGTGLIVPKSFPPGL